MAISFTKLKSSGLPTIVAKFSKLQADKKLPSASVAKVKAPKGKTYKDFNFTKFSKVAKLPKAKKVVALKKAIKKVTPKGY